MSRLLLAALLAVALTAAVPARAQELPRCPREGCGQAVTSSWWKFCPACATALPEFALVGPLADGERVLGNVYVHGKLGFRIEAPDDRWQILKGEAARNVHPQAGMAMSRAGFHALVLVRELPNVPLAVWADQLKPGLQGLETLESEEREIDGRRAIARAYRGRKQDVDLVFRVLAVEDGPRRFQAVAWMPADAWEGEGRAETARIVDSFRFLPRGK